MRAAILFAAVLSLSAVTGYGQKGIRFRSTETIGLSSGQAGNAMVIQSVNGVSLGPWFLGAGAGIDYYRFRSAPLFVSATRDIALSRNGALVLGFDWGKNVSWYKVPDPADYPGQTTKTTFSGGMYLNAGLGYEVKLGSRKGLIFSLGYSQKRVSEVQSVTSEPCLNPGYCNVNAQSTKAALEYLNRVFRFMVGVRF
jgi:hypothetical protein